MHLVTADGPGGSAVSKTPKRLRAGSGGRDRTHSDDTVSVVDSQATPNPNDSGVNESLMSTEGMDSPLLSPDRGEMTSPDKQSALVPAAPPERTRSVV